MNQTYLALEISSGQRSFPLNFHLSDSARVQEKSKYHCDMFHSCSESIKHTLISFIHLEVVRISFLFVDRLRSFWEMHCPGIHCPQLYKDLPALMMDYAWTGRSCTSRFCMSKTKSEQWRRFWNESGLLSVSLSLSLLRGVIWSQWISIHSYLIGPQWHRPAGSVSEWNPRSLLFSSRSSFPPASYWWSQGGDNRSYNLFFFCVSGYLSFITRCLQKRPDQSEKRKMKKSNSSSSSDKKTHL